MKPRSWTIGMLFLSLSLNGGSASAHTDADIQSRTFKYAIVKVHVSAKNQMLKEVDGKLIDVCAGEGTGFLVSPRHVATASHVVNLEKLKGYGCNEPSISITAVINGRREQRGLGVSLRRKDDIAIFELDNELPWPSCFLLPLKEDVFDVGGALRYGIPGDRLDAWNPQPVTIGGNDTEIDPRVLLTNAATEHGESGAPVIYNGCVAGVLVSTLGDRTTSSEMIPASTLRSLLNETPNIAPPLDRLCNPALVSAGNDRVPTPEHHSDQERPLPEWQQFASTTFSRLREAQPDVGCAQTPLKIFDVSQNLGGKADDVRRQGIREAFRTAVQKLAIQRHPIVKANDNALNSLTTIFLQGRKSIAKLQRFVVPERAENYLGTSHNIQDLSLTGESSEAMTYAWLESSVGFEELKRESYAGESYWPLGEKAFGKTFNLVAIYDRKRGRECLLEFGDESIVLEVTDLGAQVSALTVIAGGRVAKLTLDRVYKVRELDPDHPDPTLCPLESVGAVSDPLQTVKSEFEPLIKHLRARGREGQDAGHSPGSSWAAFYKEFMQKFDWFSNNQVPDRSADIGTVLSIWDEALDATRGSWVGVTVPTTHQDLVLTLHGDDCY